jgi:hypothetical protein
MEPDYANIRDFLGHLVGRTVVHVSQHDEDEFEQTQQAYVMLLFDCGDYVKFPVGEDGFSYSVDGREVPIEPFSDAGN